MFFLFTIVKISKFNSITILNKINKYNKEELNLEEDLNKYQKNTR